MRKVDPILRNFSPPGVMQLRAHRLTLGYTPPEIISMRVFGVHETGVVLHARVRFASADTSAVVSGRVVSGRIYAGASFAMHCILCSVS